ncbi:phage tail tape measure protein [Pseudoxanthomonas sp. PXM05]|uniref:phage tail tape measure protein n=1 Tax=Pseudoxanthomonas sp. PXM05 TaxID=2854775 RepID=UPI001C44233F|nr:phage tail tape measure protein [Pseudoxanthomonas sp. PXM05]MBV7475400.1 phage tail tape measure protein [Pseudoxanthomonas sp. PXM05]
MADIATLGIKVTTDGVQNASSDLDKLAKSGTNAAKGAQAVAPAMDKAALSAKQLQAATRQLPMQFTDIFTGLASGQKPLQILLQQGGQLKDTFGGIGPALRASAGYIAGLVNPITLAAAAAAGLGLAWKEQQDRLDEFNVSLAKTNNFIGMTAQQLADLTEEIDRNSVATTGGVAEAINRVVSGGRIAADQLRQVSQAAAETAALTGQSVDSIVKKYEELAKDPLDTLLKLNETEHFLTQAQYDRVKALQDEGRAQDAATEAIRIYLDNSNRMTSQVKANLSEISRSWLEVKEVASAAWREIGNFADVIVGITRRQAEANSQLIASYAAAARSANTAASLSATINYLRNIPTVLRGPRADFSGVTARVIGDSPIDSSAIRDAQKAQEEFDRLRLSNLDKAARLEVEIADIRKKGLAAGKSEAEIEKVIADARARYREAASGGRRGGGGGGGTDFGASLLQQVRQQIALNEEQAGSEKSLTESQRLRIRVTEQLEAIGGKVSAQRRAEIQAELVRLQATDAAVQKAKEQIQVESSLLRLREQIARTEAARRQANSVDLLGLGRGSEEVERQRRALDIEYQYQDDVRELYRQAAREKREVTQQEEDELRDSRDRMLAMERDFYTQRKQMQADWRNGAIRAFEDYSARVNDVASATEEGLSGILSSLEDTFAEFYRTGKFDLRKFLDDVAAEIARFAARNLMRQIMGQFGGASTSSDGAGWTGTLASLFSSDWGFASGGFTGPGPKTKPAGIVHAGEYVLNAEAVRRLPMGYLDALNAGASPSGGSISIPQTFIVQGTPDKRTREQMAREAGREARRGAVRTG